MGIRCSCGVSVPLLIAQNVPFQFLENDDVHTGTATYTANVCADFLELGTVSLVFLDTDDIDPNRSFTFTSTSIQAVECTQIGTICIVSISGMGLVAGELEPRRFSASFADSGVEGVPDQVSSFFITDFAAQIQVANVPSNSITALGCQ